MIGRMKMYVLPEGCICEQFTYLTNSGVYPTCSDMNELGDIALKVMLPFQLKKKGGDSNDAETSTYRSNSRNSCA